MITLSFGDAGQLAATTRSEFAAGAAPNVRFTASSMSATSKSPITTSVMLAGT